jgi:hypothetical protein
MPAQAALIFFFKILLLLARGRALRKLRQTVANAVARRTVARVTNDPGSGTIEGLYTILSS